MLRGKKLLVLGASPNEIALVKRAQELGVYVIVTDYYLNRDFSTAKKYADEVWDVSWSDIDTLEKLCREHHVDGAMAGYSEFRVENLIKLCRRMDFPCYITDEQLEITRNKNIFKDTCRKYGVPVIHEYASPEEVTHFPVILKPVDRGGSIGISIANNPEELAKAYDYAMECSVCKRVIIEDYISGSEGKEFNACYIVLNGEPKLLLTTDTLSSSKNRAERVIQNMWIHPSTDEQLFREKVDEKMKAMLRGIKLNTGYIFLSGFVTNSGDFMFFECGLRLGGGHAYAIAPYFGRSNILDMFIYHALTGTTGDMQLWDDDETDMKSVTVNYYATEGIIDTVEGLEEIKALPDCTYGNLLCYKGEKCDMDHAILATAAKFVFCNASAERLAEDVRFANTHFKITSVSGADMLYDQVNEDDVCNWWKKDN